MREVLLFMPFDTEGVHVPTERLAEPHGVGRRRSAPEARAVFGKTDVFSLVRHDFERFSNTKTIS